MKKILTLLIGIILLGSIFITAGIFTIKGNKIEINKVFDIKVNELDKSLICIKDKEDTLKIVKIEKCEKDKVKYSLVNISSTNLIYKNSDGLIRVKYE